MVFWILQRVDSFLIRMLWYIAGVFVIAIATVYIEACIKSSFLVKGLS